MRALVLEPDLSLNLRDIRIDEHIGPRDVRVKIHTVGICGSDVHWYKHGRIGSTVVKSPMVLGHEASGTIMEVGSQVDHLKAGDRVCMEPGIPGLNTKAVRMGIYNLDPAVRFWATPPTHGCLRPTVTHPADFTFLLPESVGFAEGAMVEPLAIGMHAATKARIKPGDVAVVHGAGTIGTMVTLAALAGGCSRIIVADVKRAKLDIVAKIDSVTAVDAARRSVPDVVAEMTGGWGADVIFECSGNEKVIAEILDPLRPAGRVVMIGIPSRMPKFDIFAARVKEAAVEHVYRYANVFDRALAMIGSGKIDVKPFITDTFAFEESVRAFDWARDMPETSVKAQIEMPQ